jgi:hypothetical protein
MDVTYKMLGWNRKKFLQIVVGFRLVTSSTRLGLARVGWCPQTFVVRHSVLDDESLDPVRMGQGHAKTHGASVILHVKRVAREAESFGEMIHDLGVVIEGIGEYFWVRPVAVSETRVIGRDKVIVIGKPGEQRLEHAR